MIKPSVPVYLSKEIHTIENNALRINETSIFSLMQRAAQKAFDVLRANWPNAKTAVVVTGKGKNAGEGYLLARLLATAGIHVRVGYVVEPERLKAEARAAYLYAKEVEVKFVPFGADELTQTDVIVDALLGIGITRPLSAEWLGAVMLMNRSKTKILALDVPSGLNPDTGALYTDAVKADVTVTFVAMKPGLLTGQGPEKSGEIHLAGLHLPLSAYDDVIPCAYRFDISTLTEWLPIRKRASHIGDYGKVLVIGGQKSMEGAALLCAQGALRTGVGMVHMVTREQYASLFMIANPEVRVHGIENAQHLDKLIHMVDSIVIGCGLGNDSWAISMLNKVLQHNKPTVLDADALNLLATASVILPDDILLKPIVITPHSLEAARLLNQSVQDIELDRLKAVKALRQKFMVAILKGSGTLVADHDLVSINTTGTPAMASAGMGEVLSGMIGGFLAQGLSLRRATRVAVWLHGLAGSRAAEEGEHGMLASDVVAKIRIVLNEHYG